MATVSEMSIRGQIRQIKDKASRDLLEKEAVSARNLLNGTIVTSDDYIMTINPGVYTVNGMNTDYLPAGYGNYGTMVIFKSNNSYNFAMYVDTDGKTAFRHFYKASGVYHWHGDWTSNFDYVGSYGRIQSIANDNAIMGYNPGIYTIYVPSEQKVYLPAGFETAGTLIVMKTKSYYHVAMFIDTDNRMAVRSFYTMNDSYQWHGAWKQIGTNKLEGSTPLERVISGASVLSGEFTLSSEVTLGINQHIIGSDCVVHCAAGAKINMSDSSSISGVKFVGTWSPTREHGDGSTYTQYGWVPLISMDDLSDEDTDALFGENNSMTDALIYIDQTYGYNTKVEGCIFEGFEQPAIYAGGLRHVEVDNPIICNNYFYKCWCGIVVDGEFERIFGNEYNGCIIGAYLKAGNINQFGEVYKLCDCGIYFPTGAVAHNEITGTEIAHCGLAGIYIKELSYQLGCQVTGCHIVDAPVIGEDVSNLLITSGRLDTFFDYADGQHNSIICSNVGKSYLYSKTSIYTVPEDTQIAMNRGMGSATDNEANHTN